MAHVIDITEILSDVAQPLGTTNRLPAPQGANVTVIKGPENKDYTTSLKAVVATNCTDQRSCTSGSGSQVETVGGNIVLPSDFSLPVSFAGTNNSTDPSAITASSMHITSGKAINGDSNTNTAMVSATMAEKNNLRVGSTFTAFNATLTVAGIFTSNTQAGENTVILPLATLQHLVNQKNYVNAATATADSLANLSSVTAAIKNALGSSADVTSNIAQANNALQPLNSVKSVSLYSLLGAAAAGAVILLLVMIMIVRERKREIGIFKAVGFSNARIMLQFVSEALTLTILGAIIGLALGVFGSSPVTSKLVSDSNTSSVASGATDFRSGLNLGDITTVHAAIGYSVLIYGLGASILIALLSSALTSYIVSKVKPAEVLRGE